MSSIDPKVVEALPYDVLVKLPGGIPPPGLEPLAPNPPSLRVQNIAVGTTFLAIATVFVAIRAYVKVSLNKRFDPADYICFAAFIFSVIQYAAITVGVTAGAAGYHMWDSSVASLLSQPNVISSWMTDSFGTPALGLAKLTFFVQYYQLFWPMRWVRLSCWIGGGMAMTFYLAVTITMFVICSPWPGETWIESLLSTHYADSGKLSIPTGVVGALTDIFLLVLPVRAVLSLQLTRKKQLGLIAIFMTGALASVASIVGVVYRAKNQFNFADAEWGVAELWIWLQIELFAGIACSCMPSLSKLFFDRKSNSNFSFSQLYPKHFFSYISERSRTLLSLSTGYKVAERSDSEEIEEGKRSYSTTYVEARHESLKKPRQETAPMSGRRWPIIPLVSRASPYAAPPNTMQDSMHISMTQEVDIQRHDSQAADLDRAGIDVRWA